MAPIFHWMRRGRDPARRLVGLPTEAPLAGVLIDHLASLAPDPRQAMAIEDRVTEYRRAGPADKLRELPAAYLFIEEQLVNDGAASLDRGRLRELVRSRYPALLGVPEFGVIFEPLGRQKVILARSFLEDVLHQGGDALRGGGHDSLLETAQWLSGIPDEARASLPLGLTGPVPTSEIEWLVSLAQVSEGVHRRLKALLGERATRMFELSYRGLVESLGSLQAFAAVALVLPSGCMEQEALQDLNPDQLRELARDQRALLAAAEARIDARGEELGRARAELRAAEAQIDSLRRLNHEIEERTRNAFLNR